MLWTLTVALAADLGLARATGPGTIEVTLVEKLPDSCEVPYEVESTGSITLKRTVDDQGRRTIAFDSLYDAKADRWEGGGVPKTIDGATITLDEGAVSTITIPAAEAVEWQGIEGHPKHDVKLRWCGPAPTTVAKAEPTQEGGWMRVGDQWYAIAAARATADAYQTVELSTRPLPCDAYVNAGEELLMSFMGTEPGHITWATFGEEYGGPMNVTGQQGRPFERKGDTLVLKGVLERNPGSWEVRGSVPLTVCP